MTLRHGFGIPIAALVIGAVAAPTAHADASGSIPGNGVFQVGAEVAPGTYKSAGPSPAGGMCSWTTHSSLGVSMDDIVDGNASTGQIYAQIPATVKAFETVGCSTWSRIT
jgi:hypothetical protein